MALLRRSDTADFSDAPLPDPRTDPDYSRALELLTAFNERYDRLEKERVRLTYEIHFAGKTPERDGETDRMLRGKLAALRALPPLKPTPAAAPATPSAAIRAGLAVMAGEPVTPAPDFSGQIADIDKQLAVLGPAITEQQGVCTELLGKQIEICARQVLPQWNSMVLEMYRAGQQLSRSTSRFRAFRARLMERGIRTETLRMPNVFAPLQLGSEEDWQSEISNWRKVLESWSLL